MITFHPNKKLAGILAPLFCLRGKHDLGIGDTAALEELIKWASLRGFGLLQLLPINETGKDHSPYHLISAMALEPSTITTHPSWIPELTIGDYKKIIARYHLTSLQRGRIQYEPVKKLKKELLTAAWKKFQHRDRRCSRSKLYALFQEEQKAWLENYTLYRALLEQNKDDDNFSLWKSATRQSLSAKTWLASLPQKEKNLFEERRDFFSYVQWIALTQWRKVFDTATASGVALMGDVPIGVSPGSADVFSAPELFDTKNFGGAPPEKKFQADPFTMKWGQNWGIPLYNWELMARDNFSWWRHRLRFLRSIFHCLRADHTLGLFRIYSFPWTPDRDEEFIDLTPEQAAKRTQGGLPHFVDHADDTPEHIAHNNRRGEILLSIFLEEIGEYHLIAEDLGETPSYVPEVLAKLEVPGFKIPLWLRYPNGTMIAGKDYPRISVATYATHDHQPIRKQWETWQAEAKSGGISAADAFKKLVELLDFIGRPDLDPFEQYEKNIHHALLRGLYATNSWLAIPMITDLFGSTQQFNTPGLLNNENWTERIEWLIADWNKKYRDVIGARLEAED